MKKAIILTAVLLTPLFAGAHQAEPEYIKKAKELKEIIAPVIYNLQEETQTQEETPKLSLNQRILLWRCKDVIRNSKADIKFKRVNENGISDIVVTDLFYDVDYINATLPQEIKDEENTAVLNELTTFILEDSPTQNDFETLVAVGVDPLKAAELTKNHCYIVVNLEENTITYKHFIKLPLGYEADISTVSFAEAKE